MEGILSTLEADLQAKYERYSVQDSQGTRLLSECMQRAYPPHAARGACARAQRRAYTRQSRLTRTSPPNPPPPFVDFAGFKYLVRSCPGLDRSDEDIAKLFTAAAGTETTRNACVAAWGAPFT
jgi:hypothetical protein